MMPRDTVNKYTEIISQISPSDDIFQAKKEYQEHTGEIFEDDKSYEMRMGSFMEWYVIDRIQKGSRLTPLDNFLADPTNSLEVQERAILESLVHSNHSLFQVLKAKSNAIQVRELFEDHKFSVTESQGDLRFNKNDLIEARLYTYNSEYFFTDNFCYHPESSSKYIRNRLKTIRNEEETIRNRLKQWEKDYQKLDKSWNNCTQKLAKLDGKIESAGNEKKRNKLEEERQKLKTEEQLLSSNKSELQQKIAELRVNEVQLGISQRRFTFIRKLSYMSLKWERSRKIDINDIYTD